MYTCSACRATAHRLCWSLLLGCVLWLSRCETSPITVSVSPQNISLANSTTSVWAVEQVHLSLRDAAHVVVHWVSPRIVPAPARRVLTAAQVTFLQGAACTKDKDASVVQYSTSPQLNDRSEVTGTIACYSTPKYQSGLIHYAVVGPLKPSVQYFYRCGDLSQGWSAIFNFTSPPLPGLQGLPYRLAVVGDMGQTKNTESTLRHLQKSAAHILLNVGDLAYADGVQRLWDRFGRMIENVTSTVPMVVAVGNHDFENMQFTAASSNTAKFHSRLLPYQLRFFPPGAHPRSTMFFSLKVSAAHIAFLATYAPYKPGTPQWTWLDTDLSGVDRRVTPWVIVVMHAPWYHSNRGHAWELQAMADALESLLFKHRVDVVFAGHTHAYERTARLYRNKLDDCGAYHMLVGDGGNREGLASTWRTPVPQWSRFRASRYGFGMLELVNASHARWGWRHNQEKKQFTDEAWMVRNESCGAVKSPGPDKTSVGSEF